MKQTSKTTQTYPSSNADAFNARLNILSSLSCARIEDVLDELGATLYRRGNKFMGPCPIHGGDNPDAVILFPEGATAPGYWRCQTRHCEHHFRSTITGFVQGVLSRQRYDWEKPGDKQVSFRESIKFLCDIVGQSFESIKIDLTELDRQNFDKAVEDWTTKKIQRQGGVCTRDQIRRHLELPADYYLKRGYRPATLERYDVGLMHNAQSVLHNRVVVPIYDETYKMVVGAIGRTLEPQCPKCGYYHKVGLPCSLTPMDKAKTCKWRTSSRKERKFVDKEWLYNYWFSRDDILHTRCVVVVEGPGDVWRLDEAGVKNSVAIFGTSPSNRQIIALECSGATSIIALTDTDSAGQDAVRSIEQKCGHFATVYRPEFNHKDVGEMDVETIKKTLVPFIASKTRRL